MIIMVLHCTILSCVFNFYCVGESMAINSVAISTLLAQSDCAPYQDQYSDTIAAAAALGAAASTIFLSVDEISPQFSRILSYIIKYGLNHAILCVASLFILVSGVCFVFFLGMMMRRKGVLFWNVSVAIITCILLLTVCALSLAPLVSTYLHMTSLPLNFFLL